MSRFKFGGWKKSYQNIAQDFASVKAPSADKTIFSGEHYLKEYTPISYQSFSDCVANSGCDALEILIGLTDPSKVVQLSRLFGYYNARAWDHATDQDGGCYIHNFWAGVKLLGVCREDLWQYEQSHLFIKPSIMAYQEGNTNSIGNFYEITSANSQRIKDIETALLNNHPVCFGTEINEDLMNYGGEDKVFFPYAGKPEGGHAMCIVGVRTINGAKQFMVRNSWGSDYGIACPGNEELGKGHFWISENYLKENISSDFFVPVLVPDLLFK